MLIREVNTPYPALAAALAGGLPFPEKAIKIIGIDKKMC
jgi:hypothetical protein